MIFVNVKDHRLPSCQRAFRPHAARLVRAAAKKDRAGARTGEAARAGEAARRGEAFAHLRWCIARPRTIAPAPAHRGGRSLVTLEGKEGSLL